MKNSAEIKKHKSLFSLLHISYWNSVGFEQFQFELVYCRATFKWRSNFGELHSAWQFKDSDWIRNLRDQFPQPESAEHHMPTFSQSRRLHDLFLSW